MDPIDLDYERAYAEHMAPPEVRPAMLRMVDEITRLRADLARVTGECDAAIARAEAAEKRDATRIEGIMAQIADLERDRDHWRTVAESRPDISREDAARYIAWRSGFAPHPRNFDRLQPIDDAMREHARKAAP